MRSRSALAGAKKATWAWLWLVILPMPATAEEPHHVQSACSERTSLRSTGTVNLRIDNDMFGGVGQDQGYSNGFLVSWVSPNLVDYRSDPCLPGIVQALNRGLALLQPEGFDEQNMTVGLSQMMYTPTDRERRDLITDDRPYAGALMFSLGYNARRGDSLRTSQLRLGVVGPAAHAEEAQSEWHRLLGIGRFHGWDHCCPVKS